MKHKTTLYLDEEMLRELKKMTISQKGESITSLVNRAIKAFLKSNKKKNKFSNFLKAKNSISPKVFGDGVEFQRRIRGNWT